MKYLIPFWWVNKIKESDINILILAILFVLISIGIMISFIMTASHFITLESMSNIALRAYLVVNLLWIIPNYYISYKVQKNTKP